MTTVDEHANRLLAEIEANTHHLPMSMLEFLRKQDVRIANQLGFSAPQFRTEIALKFSGQSERNHDLSAEIAASNIITFVELVDISSARVHGSGDKPNVFFSPSVQPGSTIFTLYGEPLAESEDQRSLIDDVIETQLDASMKLVFDSIQTVAAARETAEVANLNLQGDIGDKLYRFASKMVSTGVEIDLIWESATGKVQNQMIDFATASHIKTVLDVPRTTTEEKTRAGVIEWINLDGSFQTKLENDHGRKIELIAPLDERENLRTYWGHRVEIRFIETEIVQPQRGERKREYEFLSIRMLPQQPFIGE